MAEFKRSGKRSFGKDRGSGRSFGKDRDSGRSFGSRDSGSRFSSRSFSGSDRRGKRTQGSLTEVTCAKCGKDCQVPFKPTGDKPVYCRECFRKDDDGSAPSRSFSPRRSEGISSDELARIHEKLDKILKALNVE